MADQRPRSRRLPPPKVDSNEILRRFREGGDSYQGLDDELHRQILRTLARVHRSPDTVRKHCEQLCVFIAKHLQIAQASLVDVFSKDLWTSLLPQDWRLELEALSDEEVSLLSTGVLLRDWQSPSLSDFVATATRLDLDRTPAIRFPHNFLLAGDESSGLAVPLIAMTSKKSHEVQALGYVTASLARTCGVTRLVDVGSGKGYLGQALAMMDEGLHVVGVDASSSNTQGAQKRQNLVERLVGGKKRATAQAQAVQLAMQVEAQGGRVCGDGSGGGFEIAARAGKGGSGGGLYRAVTGKVELSNGREVMRFLVDKSEGVVREGDGVMVIGLHTCGDLAPSLLRAVADVSEVQGLCAVGCCYNLLTENGREEEESRGTEAGESGAAEMGGGVATSGAGFPLSELVLREGLNNLGRNALNLAANTNHATAVGEVQQDELSNLYRAAFQVLWVEERRRRGDDAGVPEKVAVGKIAGKSKDFLDYVRRAQKKLNLPWDPTPAGEAEAGGDGGGGGGPDKGVSDAHILGCYEGCKARIGEVRRLTALRSLLARCVESLVLLDRLCFLFSQPSPPAYAALLPLFDPAVSPRSFAMVALKQPLTLPEPQADMCLDAKEHA